MSSNPEVTSEIFLPTHFTHVSSECQSTNRFVLWKVGFGHESLWVWEPCRKSLLEMSSMPYNYSWQISVVHAFEIPSGCDLRTGICTADYSGMVYWNRCIRLFLGLFGNVLNVLGPFCSICLCQIYLILTVVNNCTMFGNHSFCHEFVGQPIVFSHVLHYI